MAWCSVKKKHRDNFAFTLPFTIPMRYIGFHHSYKSTRPPTNHTSLYNPRIRFAVSSIHSTASEIAHLSRSTEFSGSISFLFLPCSVCTMTFITATTLNCFHYFPFCVNLYIFHLFMPLSPSFLRFNISLNV